MIFLFISCLPPAFSQASDTTSIKVAAGKQYKKSAFHEFWWGTHYRTVWAEPVQVPYLWLMTFKGGITPIKQGGSFQTKNLRLIDSLGREYVLRSIDKDPTAALPASLRKTFIGKLMRDQTSVIHPYGAFIVPSLAQAAGVYHTNPKLVYLADDPQLGTFREEFAHTLMLLEERPNGNWEHLASFGNSANVISSKKVFGELMDNPRNQVDSKRYLTSRLFDMWLSDWSRREDQWRWAETPHDSLTMFSPIPRDRDHAFFKFNDGVLTALATLFKPNYQSFDKSISKANVKGLIKASKRMDAYLLAFLSKEDFIQAAQDLQQNLSDEVIAKALQQWPANIQALSSEKFSKQLKARRNDLVLAATAFYRLLNEEVLLPGTEEKERFELTFQPNGEVQVRVWSLNKNQEPLLLHHRTFYPHETKKLYLYGLDDADELLLKGEGNNQMDLRWFGGQDTDVLQLDPTFNLTGKKIKIYQEDDGNEYPCHKMLKIKDHQPAANEFSGEGWLLRHRLH